MSSIWDYRECVWHYRESTWTLDSDLLGYDVVATDGCIGLVGHVASGEPGAYVVVETCSCIHDGKRLVPARAVASLDHDHRLVRVALTQDQIRRAPAYAADQWNDDVRTQHEDYYSAHGG
jgi:hypothetical protein